MSEARVFVNYRRKDAPGSAGRLHDDLADRFGEETLFRDVHMRPGIDFVEEITRAASTCHVLLAVIGPRWATLAGPDGRPRITDASDYVRLEIETALARRDVAVIPVLVEDAVMPSPAELPPSLAELSRLHACRLGDASWDYDLERLGDAIAPFLDEDEDEGLGPGRVPASRGAEWGAAGKVMAASLAAGPLALLLSAGLHDKPVAGGAGGIRPLSDARERIAYYALERGITWAVVGAAVVVAWVLATRAGRPLVGSALAGACAGAIGGVASGLLFQGAKYLHHPDLSRQLDVPSGLSARMAGYAFAAALIGWTFARATRHLSRMEAVLAGAAAGACAAVITAATSGTWRGLSLGIEAMIVGGALALAAVAAQVARRPAPEPRALGVTLSPTSGAGAR